MAQSKSSPSNRPNRPAGKPGTKPGSKPAAKVSTSKPAAAKTPDNAPTKAPTKAPAKTAAKTAAAKAAAKKAPPRKPGKSIVNQKQTPWGLIIATVAIVIFAAAVIVVVIATRKDDSSGSTTAGGQAVDASDPYRQPALAAAMAIKDVTYRVEGEHNHVDGTIKYDSSPPRGGNHNQFWASCASGSNIYDHQIANENAVHMLEHGAVWITYNPKTATAADVAALTKYVAGQDRLALSPYAGLKTKVSLQAWGYQLFVNSSSDPRIAQFISVLKFNPKTTPENASCTDQYWTAAAAKASRPGHPFQG